MIYYNICQLIFFVWFVSVIGRILIESIKGVIMFVKNMWLLEMDKIIKYNRNISGIYADYDGLAVIT